MTNTKTDAITSAVSQRYIRTWLLLVILAVLTPIVGTGAHGGTAAALVVIALSAYKVRLVGLDFMEVRNAPTHLRVIFEIYCVSVWLVLSAAFLVF